MAITTSTNKVQYNCNGSLVDFDLAVRVLDEDDVVVLLKDTTDGSQVTLVKGSTYTIEPISGDYDNGARVTTIATYSSDFQLTILREVEFDQDLDLEEGGDLPSDSLEDALDKTVMQTQQLDERLDRTLSVPETDPAGLDYSIQSVEERASKFLAFDSSGNVTNVEAVDAGTISVDTNAGLELAGTILSVKVDDVGVEFDGTGQIELKDDGVTTARIADEAVTLAKMADMATESVIGRKTAATGVPEIIPIVGASGILINDDLLALESDEAGCTQGNVKAYADAIGATIAFKVANYFESTGNAIPALGSDLTVAHSLGSVPTLWQVVAVCVNAVNGWAEGDEFILNSCMSASYTSAGFANDTNVGWHMSQQVHYPDRSSAAAISFSGTDFEITFRAWK